MERFLPPSYEGGVGKSMRSVTGQSEFERRSEAGPSRLFRDALSDPDGFWEEHREEVRRKLDALLIRPEDDWTNEIELVIPVHNNARDLPLLLFTLSSLEADQRFGLTVVLHNSSDESERIIREATDKVRILRLDSDLLQGAPYAWQFGLAMSRGKIVAQVDADSAVDSKWLKQIVAPFSRKEVLAVSGPRRYFGDKLERSFSGRAYGFVAAASQRLGIVSQFIAGNSAVRGPAARSYARGILGSYEVDGGMAASLARSGTVVTGHNAVVYTRKDELAGVGMRGLVNKVVRVGSDRLRRPKEYSSAQLRYLTDFIPHYFPRTREIVRQWREGVGRKSGRESIRELQAMLGEHARRCAEEMRKRINESLA